MSLPPPPPSWLPDPQVPGALRGWDGQAWSPHTAVAAGTVARPAPQPFTPLPVPAALGALLALAVPLVASRWLLRGILHWNLPIALYIVILAVVVYAPSLWWWRLASRRYGTGRPAADVGLRFRPVDAGWGPVTWLACLAGQAVVAAIVLALKIPLVGNTESIRESRTVMAYVIPMVVMAVAIAPFVEEIVFRGLVLRGFAGVMPWGLAVTVQGVLFGLAHVDPQRGVGNIGLVMVLSAVGVMLGGSTYLLRRLDARVGAHAIINAIAMTVALSGWQPPSQ